MHVASLSLRDFRSYESVQLTLEPGVTVFVGPNGQGKTNLLEAVGYLATLGSHRVGTDGPLVRAGAERAIVRADVANEGRTTLVEIEINPGRANRARVNRSPVPRLREVLGAVRVVLFSPDDLALVKGDPAERRRFLDDTLVARSPRQAAVRSDYERVLKQRNALLKSASGVGRKQGGDVGHTLDVWDSHLARAGAELLAARLELLAQLRPLVREAYDSVARTGAATTLRYVPSLDTDEEPEPDREALESALLKKLAGNRGAELERGISLAGPHRDELALALGDLPARGYASHGESWSLALALRIAAFELLRSDGVDPVLLLDDVFAELDTSRRERLADLVGGAEQVLVTGAYAGDVPDSLGGVRMEVAGAEVRPAS